MQTHVVIMAGGVGSRLWPVSTPSRPKQFIDLLGCGRTMIQMTVDRFLPVCDIRNFWVVTSADYVSIVREQVPGLPVDHILAEPQARNTAPCIAYACWKIRSVCPEANIVVTPADALVLKVDVFCSVIRKALEFTAAGERIATIGITPFRPETGYGYICAERKEYGEIVKVVKFEEKPDLETAKRYLESGNYFWNAGIFVWTAATIESQIRAHAPQIASVMDSIAASFGTESEQEILHTLFPTCPKISIDYAVIEKSDVISVIAGDLGWSDLGSYSSVKSHVGAFRKPDGISSTDEANGCSTVGRNVTLVDCEGCIVHAGTSSKVVVKGLKDYIVAVNDGNVLVYPLADEQRVKDYV